MVSVLFNEKLYTYCGLGGSGLKNTLTEDNIMLNICRDVQMKGNCPDEGQTGHRGLFFKGLCVIFGAGSLYNRRVKHRECFTTIYNLNLQSLSWTKPIPSREYIEGIIKFAFIAINGCLFMFVYQRIMKMFRGYCTL